MTPDSTDSALGSRDDDCKSPSLASESSLCTSDNKVNSLLRCLVVVMFCFVLDTLSFPTDMFFEHPIKLDGNEWLEVCCLK